MDKLSDLFDKHLKTIEKCENFVSLYGEKEKHIDQLRDMKNRIDEIGKLGKELDELVRPLRENNLERAKQLIRNTTRIQLTMLNIIGELDKRDANQTNATTPNNLKPSVASEITPTPTMCLADYKKSPYVRRLKGVSLKFLDFEATILPEHFNAISSYMRGRDTVEDLQHFLDTVIVKCFTDKYQLMYKAKDILTATKDLALWNTYNVQAKQFPGQYFITHEDLCRSIERLVDKKMNNRICMLRALKIILETRKNSLIFYIWNTI